jgi:short subunit dehydrogenase-like uncharacterized protein
MPGEREYDVVLFGATGFTGGLTAEYLAANAPEGLRWALVGRNRTKLEAVAARLAAASPAAPVPALVEADAADAAALAKVAESTRVVITTVGPYALHGGPIVAACATAGTDYVDLTGEPEFVDRTWLDHDATARRTGARIVHCCGFDSVPHDLGAYFTVLQLPEGVPLKVEGFVRSNGRFSGGTYHSAVNAFGRGRQTLAAARERRKAEPRPIGRVVHSAPARIRPAADRRPDDRPPLRRDGRPLRPRLHLRPQSRRPSPGDGRRDGRRDRHHRRPRPDPAGPQAAAEGESAGRRPRRADPRR